jgi:alpha-L-fucosidase
LYFDGGRQFDSDVKTPSNAGLYAPAEPRVTGFGDPSQPDEAFLADWLARTSELVDQYQPQVLQLGSWVELPVFRPYLQKLVAAYYNRGVQWKSEVIVNYLDKTLPERAGVENVKVLPVEASRPDFWQADISLSKRSRGYIRDDELRPVDSIVDDLVDVVSKNGALLLAVGPTAEGTIPPAVENTLREIGKWLEANGEAIYGTRPWKVFGEGPASAAAPAPDQETARAPYTGQDIRFTTKSGALYAIALAWPSGGKLVIKSLADYPVKSVELLGSFGALKWTQTAGGLSLELPAQPAGQYAFAFKIL